MIRVAITKEAMNVIRGAANPHKDFRDTSQPLPDGLVSIEVDEETLARILLVSFPGESVSDTIIRVVSLRRLGLN